MVTVLDLLLHNLTRYEEFSYLNNKRKKISMYKNYTFEESVISMPVNSNSSFNKSLNIESCKMSCGVKLINNLSFFITMKEPLLFLKCLADTLNTFTYFKKRILKIKENLRIESYGAPENILKELEDKISYYSDMYYSVKKQFSSIGMDLSFSAAGQFILSDISTSLEKNHWENLLKVKHVKTSTKNPNSVNRITTVIFNTEDISKYCEKKYKRKSTRQRLAKVA